MRPLSRLVRAAAALSLLLSIAQCQAREEPGGEFVEDFERLVELVEQTHPDPYAAFGGETGFEAAATEFSDRARQIGDREELHRLAQRFLATLQDGHTTMTALAAPEEGRGRWAPLVFGIATDAMFVQAAAPELEPHVGDKLLAVGSLPLDRLLDSLRISHPTENRYGAMHRLQRLLIRRRPSWPSALEQGDPLPVTLQTPTGDTMALDLPYVEERPDYRAPDRALDLAGDNRLLHGKILERRGVRAGYFVWNAVVSREIAENAWRRDPSTAKGSFDWVFSYLPAARRSGDLEADLELMPSLYTRFSRLLEEMRSRDVEHLIIDLRRNNGGMTPLVYPLLFMLYGDTVLENPTAARYDVRISPLYLSKNGFGDIDEYNVEHGTDLALGDFKRGYLSPNDPSLPLEARRKSEDWTFAGYGRDYVDRGEPLLPDVPRVVVITSSTTFSAAFHFVYYLTEIGSATVVGVPPRQAPNAFMENTPFQLPNSGLRGSIANAVQALYPEGTERTRVFLPDYSMNWSDLQRYDFDPDAEILYALDLIEAGRIPG